MAQRKITQIEHVKSACGVQIKNINNLTQTI